MWFTSHRDFVLLIIIYSETWCLHSFLFFIQIFVVCFTVFGGLMAFNYHRELRVWVVPLLLVALFAYLVAHSFLSVFETIIDALFLCFAIDIETNDGSQEKPYFMDHELMVSIHSGIALSGRLKRLAFLSFYFQASFVFFLATS